MGLLDEMIDNMKGSLVKKKESMLEKKQIKEGRTWKQIAMEFTREVLKILRKKPEGFSIRGEDLRPIVADPTNNEFRRQCLNQGIRITKAKGCDIFRIEKHDIVNEMLKKKQQGGEDEQED